MRSMFNAAVACAAAAALFGSACDDDNIEFPEGTQPGTGSGVAPSFVVTNLVADQPGVAAFTDVNLVNPWGVVPLGDSFWIADNGTGKVTVVDGNGAPSRSFPSDSLDLGEGITGATFLGGGFPLPGNRISGDSTLLFASEDGRLIAVDPSTSSPRTVVDRSAANANYKGVALVEGRDGPFILAADFFNAQIDAFDSTFTLTSSTAFVDPTIPVGFAPFNVAAFGDRVYVTWAFQDQDRADDVPGSGMGYITVFDSSGTRLATATNFMLNAPWGMTIAPAGFAEFGAGTLLVGNFGDGHVTAFEPTALRPIGQLGNPDGSAIAIDGLWGLTFGTDTAGSANALYFTAGPGDEAHGLFGIIESL